MLFATLKRDIKDIKTCTSILEKKIDKINTVLYNEDGGGYQSRLVKAESDACNALATVLSRTTAMWTVFAFALLAIGGVIGYQMVKIDGLEEQCHALAKEIVAFSITYLNATCMLL